MHKHIQDSNKPMIYLSTILYFGLCYLVALKSGKHKKFGFLGTFLISLVCSPFIGYLIAEGSAQKKPKGCTWCDNKQNEAEFCGLCGKNETGMIRSNFNRK